jgi:protein phosphatase
MVDVQEIEAEPGDCFILCSDGLTTMLSDDEIRERVNMDLPLEDVCRTLVRDANAKGGLDNITVLLLAVDSVSDPEE